MADQPEVIWEPMPGKVVVELIGASDFLVNRNGVQLFASPSSRGPRTTGKVIAIPEPWQQGEGEPTLESFVQVGDMVIFGQHSGVEVEYGRRKVTILREIEILTKVKLPPDLAVEDVGVARGDNDDVE